MAFCAILCMCIFINSGRMDGRRAISFGLLHRRTFNTNSFTVFNGLKNNSCKIRDQRKVSLEKRKKYSNEFETKQLRQISKSNCTFRGTNFFHGTCLGECPYRKSEFFGMIRYREQPPSWKRGRCRFYFITPFLLI